MLDLFFRPILPNREPDLIHLDGRTFRPDPKLTPEQRRQKRLEQMREYSKQQRLERGVRGES